MCPANILITQTGVIKISDFGQCWDGARRELATDEDNEGGKTPGVCTLWYRAPEILQNQPYSFPVDVWALGCVIGEVVLGVPVLGGRNEAEQLALARGLPTTLGKRLPEEVDPELVNLLEGLLKFKEAERMTAGQVRRHVYVSRDWDPKAVIDLASIYNN